ncbi:zf-HC2 domain-containing protein [Streptomyces sp. Z26]|uniref:zf-HC2 domain-containing protein n=1 Tax=Streptomyces sp. Z26 TaxID=2500177 RepID=UPI000EF1586C|nr:zf-HC2 domain-containing protein [Streptomyces sp. Z26]RLL67119.1 zf-HC2 domain-containing protein [Streptomyces sp. Z26]
MTPPDDRNGPAEHAGGGPGEPPPARIAHSDVGAYALGLLDGAEAAAFEEHLAGCERCQGELDGMLALRDVLAEARGDGVRDDAAGAVRDDAPPAAVRDEAAADGLFARPRPELLDRLLDGAARRRRADRLRRVLVAAAAVLLVGGGGAALGALGGGDDGGTGGRTTEAASVRAMFREGEQHRATDPGTEVDATVSLLRKPWGTYVTLRIGNLRGPRECDLVVVGLDGERRTVGSWSVPKYGYGIEGTRWNEPLYITGGAGLTPDRIDRFEVRTLDGERLASVPL